MIKWRKILRDIIIAATISVAAFIFVLPVVVNYIIYSKDPINKLIKENITMAAQNYFKEETGKDLVSIGELSQKGYIENQDYLKNKKCNINISTVSMEKININKKKYSLYLYCDNNISKLTLSN